MEDQNEVPSLQEMFNRAWLGLKSQGFTRCTMDDEYDQPRCVYDDGNGRHCAWGWVDSASWPHKATALYELNQQGIGLAPRLSDFARNFANRLQSAHDGASDPADMEAKLRALAEGFSLTIPE